MQSNAIVVEPHGRSWAIKHNNSFLGFAETRDEAAIIAQDLVEWMKARGRAATIVLDELRAPTQVQPRPLHW